MLVRKVYIERSHALYKTFTYLLTYLPYLAYTISRVLTVETLQLYRTVPYVDLYSALDDK